MHIVNLSSMQQAELAEAVTRAQAEDRRFRIAYGAPYESVTGEQIPAQIIYKVGEGMWSAPMYDQTENDPYRDNPFPGGVYRDTHTSVYSGSPAMRVTETDNTITLVNEDGHMWTDPILQWQPIEGANGNNFPDAPGPC